MINIVITKIYIIKSAVNLAIDYIIKREKILLSLFKSHQSTDHIQFIKIREDNDTKSTVLLDI